jgi:hypothetical protein
LTAGGAAALSLNGKRAGAAESGARSTVRDRFWIFTVYAGGDNDYLERAGVRGGSRMTPAEGAFWLNVPNLLFIRSHDTPPLPGGQQWRAKTAFEQYAISFQPLDRVVWSVVGSGGKGGLGELGPVIQLARKFPNFHGIYLDDFIAEVTQHIPEAGQHLIHYYGWYSNKTRGLRKRAAAECGRGLSAATASADPAQPSTAPASASAIEEELSRAAARRRWAALIKRVYEVDPLVCPKCGGEMRVSAFIEGRQRDVIRKILEHCGLWEEPRAPARPPPVEAQASLELRYEADPDYTPAPEEP